MVFVWLVFGMCVFYSVNNGLKEFLSEIHCAPSTMIAVLLTPYLAAPQSLP